MPDKKQRRRKQDNGILRYAHGVPAAIGAVVLLAGIVTAFTTVEVTVSAQGDELRTIRKTQQNNFRPRIRKLETNQAGMAERLEAIQQEQHADTVRQASGRLEILDAIKSLGDRITNRP